MKMEAKVVFAVLFVVVMLVEVNGVCEVLLYFDEEFVGMESG